MFWQTKNPWVLWARNRAYNLNTGDVLWLGVSVEEGDIEIVSITHLTGTAPSDVLGAVFKEPYLSGFMLPWIEKNCGKAIYQEFIMALRHETDRIMGVRTESGIESGDTS